MEWGESHRGHFADVKRKERESVRKKREREKERKKKRGSKMRYREKRKEDAKFGEQES
jgi:hypothetical protein